MTLGGKRVLPGSLSASRAAQLARREDRSKTTQYGVISLSGDAAHQLLEKFSVGWVVDTATKVSEMAQSKITPKSLACPSADTQAVEGKDHHRIPQPVRLLRPDTPGDVQ